MSKPTLQLCFAFMVVLLLVSHLSLASFLPSNSMEDSLKDLWGANSKIRGSKYNFGKYLRRSAPAYWGTSSEANEMRLTSPARSSHLDNFRVLPPVKRLDVKSRSILCYFNSVSCYGR